MLIPGTTILALSFNFLVLVWKIRQFLSAVSGMNRVNVESERMRKKESIKIVEERYRRRRH